MFRQELQKKISEPEGILVSTDLEKATTFETISSRRIANSAAAGSEISF